MQPVLFLADDDVWFSQLLAAELEKYGYSVRVFTAAGGVIKRAEAELPTLFLLGIAAQGTIDLGLYYSLRRHHALASTPVILLSSNAGNNGIYGLDVGAEAYLAKPVNPPELIACIKRLMGPSDPFASSVIRVGPMEIDSDCMTVSVSGKRVLLTTTEFRILEYLARNPGRLFGRKEILHAIWPNGRSVTPRSVDSHIWRLREKVEPVPERPVYLQTIHGQGYCLVAPD
jgi:two-component system phosphate regulon response regulator PhoB